MVCSQPAETLLHVVMTSGEVDTAAGTSLCVVVLFPVPSCPAALLPQHARALDPSWMAHVCSPPAETFHHAAARPLDTAVGDAADAGGVPTPSWPLEPSPAQVEGNMAKGGNGELTWALAQARYVFSALRQRWSSPIQNIVFDSLSTPHV